MAKLERKPRFAVAVTVVFFAWLYLPILAVAGGVIWVMVRRRRVARRRGGPGPEGGV